MEPHNLPAVMWKTCPIRSSLGVLGRAWTLLVLRDVSFFRKVRFSDILNNNPGLSARLLSIRLKELQKEKLIDRVVNPDDHRGVWYNITPKGLDVVPILAASSSTGRSTEPRRSSRIRRRGHSGPYSPATRNTCWGSSTTTRAPLIAKGEAGAQARSVG
jgi:DNA-binding HxlR family transcriptional regulator